MERARPLTRVHDRTERGGPSGRARAAAAAGVVLSAVLLGGCDSVSGIPVDDPAPPRAAATTTTTTAQAPAAPVTTALAPPPADAPTVGEVPGLPDAAVAVRRWAADLRTDTPAELQAKCWTIAPGNVTEMYQGKQAILTALAQPGVASGQAVTWKNRTTTVTVERDLVHTGYACPRVATAGGEVDYNDADARHTVRRYLARQVGKPLAPADVEADYPLVCRTGTAAWDPKETGAPTQPPLAANPAKLSGVTAFEGQEISSNRLSSDYLTVDVPTTDSTGATKTRTFTLAQGPEGFCIGDVTA